MVYTDEDFNQNALCAVFVVHKCILVYIYACIKYGCFTISNSRNYTENYFIVFFVNQNKLG